MDSAEIGIIGGSGLYSMESLQGEKRVSLETPFGPPSAPYVLGDWHGRRVAFLARHGEGHLLLPTEIPYRANIYGFRMLGVERILSVSAVGSMKEEIAPGEIVLPDQFVDRTRQRISTFFGGGIAAHISFAEPICDDLRGIVRRAAARTKVRIHDGGTYLCMEGPQFSTRAESLLYRNWGMSVIGMTNLQEAKLAREAELCYATLALVTDYDTWHEEEESVNVGSVLDILRANVARAREILAGAVPLVSGTRKCACSNALRDAILTEQSRIPPETRQRLRLLLEKYLEA
ncbi:MAG: S-methyl-5'-thioadenosine phosphorylase [Acidobacteriota bacterium]